MILEVLTSRYSSASFCYELSQINHILLPSQHNTAKAPSHTTCIFEQAISYSRGAPMSEKHRHQPAKRHEQSNWVNRQAPEASWPASSCLFTAGNTKSNKLLLEPHLCPSLGTCCFTTKERNSFGDSMQPVGHVLCMPALSLEKGKTEKYMLW